jgi:hypothetical protein
MSGLAHSSGGCLIRGTDHVAFFVSVIAYVLVARVMCKRFVGTSLR